MKKLLLIFAFAFLFGLTVSGQSNDSLALGNPSDAKIDEKKQDNFLVDHDGYTLSYNKSRGAANWVAWHLERSDIGDAERTNAFAPDTILPRDWWILPTDYSGSGFDRGHLCPSKDRSSSEESNRVTFLMSNMQPQAPKLNQKTWKYLEDYTRETVKNNEAYVYAGCYGDAGRIKNKVTVPTRCWKIVVLLPNGDNDVKRINSKTRIIAVDMPNDESVSSRWRTYLTTVDEIEKQTGYNFLASVPKRIQSVIEAAKDSESEPAEASGTNKTTTTVKKNDSGDRRYLRGSRGGCYYLTAPGNKSYVDKKFCESITTSSDSREEVKTAPAQPKASLGKKQPGSNNSDGREYTTGPRGGCYYINSSGRKTYVDKNKCN
jgi:DNA/RNA endonuclease G (NUC1)